MDDINTKVLNQGYGLKIYSAMRNRGSFICKTDKGIFEIKKNYEKENNILFENDVKKHLLEKGFPHVCAYEQSNENKPFYFLDGTYFVVEKYVPSQPADLTNFDILYNAVRMLAQLHNLSQGVESQTPIFREGQLIHHLKKRKSELFRIRKRIHDKGIHSKIDRIVAENFEYYQQKIEQAIYLLEQCNYEKLLQIAKEKKMVCHNTYKGENILQAEQGDLLISGFFRCCYDYSILDLAEFIRRHFKNPLASIQSVDHIFLQYDKIRTISSEDKTLIFAMLLYPYKFLKICNEYYNKRRVYVSEAMVNKLSSCLEQTQRTEKILTELISIPK